MKVIENYYPLIGQVVVRFQDLDMFVNIVMAALLNEDPNVTMAFMVTLPFSKKLDVLRSVAPFKFGRQDLVLELDKVLPILSRAEENRNRVVHAAWLGSSGGNTVFFHKPRATRKTGMKDGGIRHAAPGEIEGVIKIINDALDALCKLGCSLEKAGAMKTKMFEAFPSEEKS